jgi:hypothetical protein
VLLRDYDDDAVKPAYVARALWRDYAPLVRLGYVTWGDPPDGIDAEAFAGVTITARGLAALEGKG